MCFKKLIPFAVALCLIVIASRKPAMGEVINWTDPLGSLTEVYPGFFAVTPTDPSGNRVTISADVGGNVLGGHRLDPPGSASAGRNIVQVGAVTVEYGVFGSMITYSGPDGGRLETSSNTVTLSGSKINSNVVGGNVYSSDSADLFANNNAVTATNSRIGMSGPVNGMAYGGSAEVQGPGNSTANSNTLKLADTVVYGPVKGGTALSHDGIATASGNQVDITGGSLTLENSLIYLTYTKASLAGGESIIEFSSNFYAVADNNVVNINNINISSRPNTEFMIIGGYSESSKNAQANNNAVNLYNIANISPAFFIAVGGRANSRGSGNVSANKNTITATHGTYDEILGGWARSSIFGHAEANDNTVSVADVIASMIVGGNVRLDGGVGSALRNTVTVTDGSVVGLYAGLVYGTLSGDAFANDNSATVLGGDVPNANGGFANTGVGTASANRNTFTALDGTFGRVTGGQALTFSGNVFANNNTVSLQGGTAELVRGGWVHLDDSGDRSEANGNTVVLADAQTNQVFGGYVCGGQDCNGTIAVTAAEAVNNTVILSGTTKVAGRLYGGRGEGFSSGEYFSGNRLIVQTPDQDGINVNYVENFEYFDFVFDGTRLAGAVGLDIIPGGQLYLHDPDSDAVSQISGIDVANGGTSLSAGQELTLVSGPIDAGGFAQTSASGFQGGVVRYDYSLHLAAEKLTATVTSVKTTESSKSIPEGVLGGTGILIQAADHAGGPTIENAVLAVARAARGAPIAGPIMAAFGTVSAGSVRHETGSHVDADGFSLSAGLAFGRDLGPGRLVLGGFVEYGIGSYDTFNSFPSVGSVHGQGDTRYIGGGVIGRLELASGTYLEASGRIGKIGNEYSSRDLIPGRDALVEYESRTPYVGLHLGVGRKIDLTGADRLDVYGKFFWTRQNSDRLALSNGAPVAFSAVDSLRLRIGARYSRDLGGGLGLFAGAAYEREFDGRASATAYGLPIEAPELKGDTGVGELGISLKPGTESPLTFELGVQGLVGKRRGATGNFGIRVEF